MMGRMREISREPSCRPLVTFLAGLHDIVVTQMRLWVGYPENIVRAMAIITLGGLCVPQL